MITGQSVAFTEACNAVPEGRVVDSAFSSIGKILSYPFRLLAGFLQTRRTVYFTSSRSYVGFYFRDIPLILFCVLFRRRVINHLHGNDFNLFRKGADPFTRILLDASYRRIDISCAPTLGLLQQYERYPAMKKAAVPNFFDPNIIARSEFSCSQDTISILFLSNLIYSKGFKAAFEAFVILRKRGIQANITFCGAPVASPEFSEKDISKFLRRLVDNPFAEYLGVVQGPDKWRILNTADVLVLPTSYPTEAAPISIIEGFAAGCYVVTTAVGAIPEMVDGFEFAIVAPTPVQIANAIQSFAVSGDREGVARLNRNLAIERYSLQRFHANIRAIFYK